MDRKKQQADLLYKLGLLLAPLQEIVEHPEEHDAASRTRAHARFVADAPILQKEIKDFTTSEPGHNYESKWAKCYNALHILGHQGSEKLGDPEALKILLEEKYHVIRNAILSIPIPTDSLILEAYTPFSTYCAVKDLCQTAAERLIWVDRYLDDSIFYRYLRDVSVNANVTLLTWPNRTSDAGFINTSRLYATERGPDNYKLVVNQSIHDRWLCCDSKIYQLGGSIKDASRKDHFTLSKIDATQENLNKIEQLLNSGTEIFGPAQPNHP